MSHLSRVTKQNPCPICKKPDWCMIGTSITICMRAQSAREKMFSDGSVGWIHALDGAPVRIEPRKERSVVAPNIAAMWSRWRQNTRPSQIHSIARDLGVDFSALDNLGCALRDQYTMAFPMRDDRNNIVGIRLRTSSGKKFAVEGSHSGLFIPQLQYSAGMAYIVEGPTDAAAALTLGLFAIGRPSCSGGATQLIELIKRLNIRRAVIVADTDTDKVFEDGKVAPNPGIDGALRLSEHLGIPNCVLSLPCKDMRSFLVEGGDKSTIVALVSQCVWRTK